MLDAAEALDPPLVSTFDGNFCKGIYVIVETKSFKKFSLNIDLEHLLLPNYLCSELLLPKIFLVSRFLNYNIRVNAMS